jgi:uncharacterized membrane protein (UPF0127 family)
MHYKNMNLKQGLHMLNFDNPLTAKSHFGTVIFPIFTTLPTTLLKAGTHTIYTEVASTEKSREIGLMYRKKLPENNGMLFVFETLDNHCFWMENTDLPLSIAFLRDDGTIIKIADMQPYSLYKHCPNEPVRYALEMNQGWFAKKNINVGTRIINKKYFN